MANFPCGSEGFLKRRSPGKNGEVSPRKGGKPQMEDLRFGLLLKRLCEASGNLPPATQARPTLPLALTLACKRPCARRGCRQNMCVGNQDCSKLQFQTGPGPNACHHANRQVANCFSRFKWGKGTNTPAFPLPFGEQWGGKLGQRYSSTWRYAACNHY